MNPSPGPWKWVPGYWDMHKLVSEADVIIKGGSSGDFHVYSTDDAELIIAAPEMREMLLKLEGAMLETGDCCAWCQELEHTPKDCEFAALLERVR